MTQSNFRINNKLYNSEQYEAPSDRTFRAAWRVAPDEVVVTIDMEKARELWRDKIRLARIERFKELDADFMKALERGEDITLIAVQRQALRDAPSDPLIDLATTPDELKAVQPAGLKVI